MMFCWCALEANSGTTPPKASCTFCPAMILLKMVSFLMIAAEVSSQEDSIPRMVMDIFFVSINPSYLHRWISLSSLLLLKSSILKDEMIMRYGFTLKDSYYSKDSIRQKNLLGYK